MGQLVVKYNYSYDCSYINFHKFENEVRKTNVMIMYERIEWQFSISMSSCLNMIMKIIMANNYLSCSYEWIDIIRILERFDSLD
jgi:alpha-D-ribose 1-methylphosphonate 5-triphosphate synthase subunit PhnI